MNQTTNSKKKRYITGFDGIRTIAVIGVIFVSPFPQVMRGGYLGVPIFFVVSGYLINDLLRQEWAENQTIDLKVLCAKDETAVSSINCDAFKCS